MNPLNDPQVDVGMPNHSDQYRTTLSTAVWKFRLAYDKWPTIIKVVWYSNRRFEQYQDAGLVMYEIDVNVMGQPVHLTITHRVPMAKDSEKSPIPTAFGQATLQ